MRALALGAVAVLLLGACEEDQPAPAPIPSVRVEIVEPAPPTGAVSYTANIAADTQVNVSFQVGGTVQSLMQVPDGGGTRKIQAGDRVAPGDVLATVDPSDYNDSLQSAQASLSSAQASLAAAKANWERTQALYETQSATATDYDNARQQYDSAAAQVQSAQANLASAQTNLARTDLTAPMAGVVLEVDVEVGTLVSPQTQGFVLADTSKVKAQFGVPDSMLGAVRIGDPLSVTVASIPGETFDGVVTSVAPSADSSTRLFQVEVTLPNADGRLLVGMIASLSLRQDAGQTPTATVPVDALVRSQTDPQGYAVYVVDKGQDGDIARLRDVTIGQVTGNQIAITSGLEAGDSVIVVGTNTVADGAAVRVVP